MQRAQPRSGPPLARRFDPTLHKDLQGNALEGAPVNTATALDLKEEMRRPLSSWAAIVSASAAVVLALAALATVLKAFGVF